MTANGTCMSPDEVESFLDDRLPADAEQSFVRHLETCTACRDRLEALAAGADDWSNVGDFLREDSWPDGEAEGWRARPSSIGAEPSRFSAAGCDDSTGELLKRLAPTDDPEMLGRLGAYEVKGLIGRGGMGLVLKAFDRPLNRYVAIKLVAPELAAGGSARQRFAREAQAAAAVVHEHVIAIHSVSEFKGLPYLVMTYIPGKSLQQRLERTGPLAVAEVLRIAHQTASGLAAAHAQGVVHRDVKPANILLENGVERVTITDFGLARMVDDVSVTRSGVIAGTPQYMAPEQAHGGAVDHRSDLFSLGSVMYATCTGRPPFRGDTPVSVLHRVCHEEPRPIREINPEIPEWLVEIVARLHAKDPADRFQSAGDLADLLEAHLAHLQHPVSVPAPPRLPPLPKRRQPRKSRLPHGPVLAALYAVGLVVAIGGLVSLARFAGSGTAATDPDSGRLAPGREGSDREPPVYAGAVFETKPAGRQAAVPMEWIWAIALSTDGRLMAVGHGHWQSGPGALCLWDPVARKELGLLEEGRAVASIAISPDKKLLAYGTWEHVVKVYRLDGLKKITEISVSGSPRVAFSHDGRLLAVASEAAELKLYDAATWKERPVKFEGELFGFQQIRFSPDGRLLLAGGGSFDANNRFGRGVIWEVETGRRLTTVNHTAVVMQVDFAPDGNTFATASLDARAKIWETATGQQVRAFFDPEAGLVGVSFSPDGGTLATVGPKSDVKLWDVARGNLLARLRAKENTQHLRAIAFSPDGKLLASGGQDRVVRLWDPVTHSVTAKLEPGVDSEDADLRQPILAIACSPTGGLIAAGREDGTIALHDSGSGRIVRILTGHKDQVASVAFSPDGSVLASAGFDGAIKLWNPATGAETKTLRGHETWVMAIAFSPDGKTIATGSYDRTVRLWDAETGTERAKLEGHAASVQAVAFSPDGKWLVSGSSDRTAKIWDLGTDEAKATLRGHKGAIRAVAVSPDGRLVATGSEDTTVKLWDAETGRELRSLSGHGRMVFSLAFSPDGKTLASGGYDQRIKLWDTATGAAGQTIGGHSDVVSAVAFVPNSGVLVSGSFDQTLKVWPRRHPAEVRRFEGVGNWMLGIAMTPDGKGVLTGRGPMNSFQLWDAGSGDEIRRFEGHAGAVQALAVSRDGRLVVSGSGDRTARLWDFDTGQELRRFEGHTDRVRFVAFTPDGRHVLTTSDDKSAILWDTETGREVRRYEAQRAQRMISSAAVSPDGRHALLPDGKMCVVWELESGDVVRRLEGHDFCKCAAYSPDGRLALTGHGDGTVTLWDTATGKEIRRLVGHADYLRCVAFSPDGEMAVSGGEDRTLIVWDVKSGEAVSRFAAHGDRVLNACFAPDGQHVLSSAEDGTARLWKISREKGD